MFIRRLPALLIALGLSFALFAADEKGSASPSEQIPLLPGTNTAPPPPPVPAPAQTAPPTLPPQTAPPQPAVPTTTSPQLAPAQTAPPATQARPTATAVTPPPQTVPPQPTTTPTPYLTPDEELKKIFLKDGYSLELVVSEPDIQDPVLAVFDGNGRMYVAEMRSYMRTVDGANQSDRTSRVSVHWSSKGDGNFDRHAVFADNLLLPRMILPLKDGVLINETYSDNIWLFRDTNGDGIADTKELFYGGGPRGENLEHQPSGLIWALDNWLYMAANPYRLRISGTNVLREGTAANFGQWGLTQDDNGKPWFSNAGYESGPVNFEMPIIYGDFQAPEQHGPEFPVVWPMFGLADYQGGPVRVRPEDQTLNHFTATCGQDIFRGDRLPVDLRGDMLFGEPVGRLIRRARITVTEGFTKLSNVYESDHSEFIRSTDPNFRPINMVTAPDGTLYIVDMYRGLIQESAWVNPGSYLRPIVQQHELEKNLGRGRIWRLVHQDFQPGPQPHMLDESPAQLVKHLSNSNGWWRDNAQKLLVLKGDKSVVPALTRMARTDSFPLARVHALWTLEGLGAFDVPLLREALADKSPQVRIAAIRVSESLCKHGDQSLVSDVLALAQDSDPNVVLQVLMTATLLKWPDTQNLINTAIATNSAYGVKRIGGRLLQSAAGIPVPQEFTMDERARLVRGEQVYKQLCFACHGLDGMGTPLAGATNGMAKTMAPAFGGSKICNGPRDAVINIVLKGLIGPVEGTNYTAQMVPMQSNDDHWIASVISYIRNNFGNSSSMIEPIDVARVRAAYTARNVPWTLPELSGTVAQPIGDRWRWKASASHNDKWAGRAIDDDQKSRFETHAQQVPGMWFEVKFPWDNLIGGLLLDAGESSRDFPRGYSVELSEDGKKWGAPVATGHGTSSRMEITFPPAKARYVRVTQTTLAPGHSWSIADFEVFKPTPPPPPESIVQRKPAVSVYE